MLGVDWRSFEDSLFEVPTNANGAIEFEPFEEHVLRLQLDNCSIEFIAPPIDGRGLTAEVRTTEEAFKTANTARRSKEYDDPGDEVALLGVIGTDCVQRRHGRQRLA